MAANNKNNKKNSEVTMFRVVLLLVEVSRVEGRFFLRRGQGSLFLCSLKKYSRFISERGAPDMDALMHYRQFCRNFIYSRPRKLRKIYSTSSWLVWIFRGGGGGGHCH